MTNKNRASNAVWRVESENTHYGAHVLKICRKASQMQKNNSSI